MSRALESGDGALAGLRLYVGRQTSRPWRHVVEQALCLLVEWIPTVSGIGLCAALGMYKYVDWCAYHIGSRLPPSTERGYLDGMLALMVL